MITNVTAKNKLLRLNDLRKYCLAIPNWSQRLAETKYVTKVFIQYVLIPTKHSK